MNKMNNLKETENSHRVLPAVMGDDCSEDEVSISEFKEIFLSTQQSQKLFQIWFSKQISYGISRVNFFVGGAYGIEKSILPSGIQFLSLSEMTFTHQMVRLFLLEQIYRAFTIIRGEPYHNY